MIDCGKSSTLAGRSIDRRDDDLVLHRFEGVIGLGCQWRACLFRESAGGVGVNSGFRAVAECLDLAGLVGLFHDDRAPHRLEGRQQRMMDEIGGERHAFQVQSKNNPSK